VAHKVELAPRGLRIGGDDVPLTSGALHYFRTERKYWGKCLRAIRDLGFRAVETYVPWGVHELRRGKYDFAGGRDLGAFLDAAGKEGLYAIVRPGPHINAELAWFGFPERIVTDERMQARTARGTPVSLVVPPRGFPVPSYFSTEFRDEVRSWLTAVGEIVAPRLAPDGPVVAVQVDNEHAHFFRSGAYEGDYHPAAVARFREQTGEEPPRRFDAHAPADLAPHLAWLAFREREGVAALAAIAAMLVEAGMGGVPHFHNFPPHDPTTYDVCATEAALAFAGIDFYQGRTQYRRNRHRALYLAGSSRLPYVPELGVGSFPWGPPLTDEDSTCLLLNLLGSGVAGYNAYMLVERDRWYGSPIGPDGLVRPGLAERLRKVNQALAAAGWTGLSREAQVGVIIPRSYGRLALASSHVGPIGPAFAEWMGLSELETARESTFGLDGPVQLEQARWREAILDALGRSHVPFVIVDGSAPPERLARHSALIVPTFDFVERDLA
jgi:beta-galactosidase